MPKEGQSDISFAADKILISGAAAVTKVPVT